MPWKLDLGQLNAAADVVGAGQAKIAETAAQMAPHEIDQATSALKAIADILASGALGPGPYNVNLFGNAADTPTTRGRHVINIGISDARDTSVAPST